MRPDMCPYMCPYMEVHVLELKDALDANKVFYATLYVSLYVSLYGSARAKVERCVGRE